MSVSRTLALSLCLLCSRAALAGPPRSLPRDPLIEAAYELHRETLELLSSAASVESHLDPLHWQQQEGRLHAQQVELLGRLDLLGNRCLGNIPRSQLSKAEGMHDVRSICIESIEYDAEQLRARFAQLNHDRIPRPKVEMLHQGSHPILEQAYEMHVEALWWLLHSSGFEGDLLHLEERMVRHVQQCLFNAPEALRGICSDMIAADMSALFDKYGNLMADGSSNTNLAQSRSRGAALRTPHGKSAAEHKAGEAHKQTGEEHKPAE